MNEKPEPKEAELIAEQMNFYPKHKETLSTE